MSKSASKTAKTKKGAKIRIFTFLKCDLLMMPLGLVIKLIMFKTFEHVAKVTHHPNWHARVLGGCLLRPHRGKVIQPDVHLSTNMASIWVPMKCFWSFQLKCQVIRWCSKCKQTAENGKQNVFNWRKCYFCKGIFCWVRRNSHDLNLQLWNSVFILAAIPGRPSRSCLRYPPPIFT